MLTRGTTTLVILDLNIKIVVRVGCAEPPVRLHGSLALRSVVRYSDSRWKSFVQALRPFSGVPDLKSLLSEWGVLTKGTATK